MAAKWIQKLTETIVPQFKKLQYFYNTFAHQRCHVLNSWYKYQEIKAKILIYLNAKWNVFSV